MNCIECNLKFYLTIDIIETKILRFFQMYVYDNYFEKKWLFGTVIMKGWLQIKNNWSSLYQKISEDYCF